MKISELTPDQKGHLVYRLDHNTLCGILTASSVARGEHGDLELVEVFMKYGDQTRRSASIWASKVENFTLLEHLEKTRGKRSPDEITEEVCTCTQTVVHALEMLKNPDLDGWESGQITGSLMFLATQLEKAGIKGLTSLKV